MIVSGKHGRTKRQIAVLFALLIVGTLRERFSFFDRLQCLCIEFPHLHMDIRYGHHETQRRDNVYVAVPLIAKRRCKAIFHNNPLAVPGHLRSVTLPVSSRTTIFTAVVMLFGLVGQKIVFALQVFVFLRTYRYTNMLIACITRNFNLLNHVLLRVKLYIEHLNRVNRSVCIGYRSTTFFQVAGSIAVGRHQGMPVFINNRHRYDSVMLTHPLSLLSCI